MVVAGDPFMQFLPYLPSRTIDGTSLGGEVGVFAVTLPYDVNVKGVGVGLAGRTGRSVL